MFSKINETFNSTSKDAFKGNNLNPMSLQKSSLTKCTYDIAAIVSKYRCVEDVVHDGHGL